MSCGKIMVVDDDSNICELFPSVSRKEDYEVVIAQNGTKALRCLTAKPDLILLDIMMPVLTVAGLPRDTENHHVQL